MAGHCADCTACCQVFEVKEIPKAFGEPCRYIGKTALGTGCTIYQDRPMPCRNYVCLYLDSQRREGVEKMPEELRPNVCRVVLGWPWGTDRNTLFVYPLPGYENAWRIPPVSEHLRMILSRGGKVVVVIEKKRYVLKGDMAVVGTEEEFAELLT